MTKNLTIYQAENGAIELKADSMAETIWASQKQIAQIFDVTPQNITIHLKQIFSDNELKKKQLVKNPYKFKKRAIEKLKEILKNITWMSLLLLVTGLIQY